MPKNSGYFGVLTTNRPGQTRNDAPRYPHLKTVRQADLWPHPAALDAFELFLTVRFASDFSEHLAAPVPVTTEGGRHYFFSAFADRIAWRTAAIVPVLPRPGVGFDDARAAASGELLRIAPMQLARGGHRDLLEVIYQMPPAPLLMRFGGRPSRRRLARELGVDPCRFTDGGEA